MGAFMAAQEAVPRADARHYVVHGGFIGADSLAPRTVHTHAEHLSRRTGAATRAEATALAVRDGVLRPTAEDVERFAEGPSGG
ncbi:LuxR family transcriptional regulator [Streptomyces bottropensis]|uniref:LuxR family transcriptional regulator n=1 Tax=Streptomyces bottropensis TaxID=42235 RepID=A0ABU8AW42_9ACTN